MTKCAIWARVSTSNQHTANQLAVLRQWAADRGLDVAAEFETEDSAWQGSKARNGKGAEFDRKRRELLNGARLGHYQVVLIWSIDRLSRKGIEDTLATMRQLYEVGADIWSHQEDWLRTSDPHMRELLVSFFAWLAQQESARRSERIKAGIAQRRRDIEKGLIEGQIGGRKPGSKDKRKRDSEPYKEAWKRRQQAS
jgi:putative DNA-invertase from lambdoid prophage Rac